MQHYKLALKCGHYLETSCVDQADGMPYVPKYVGQEMPSPPVRCCDGDHTVSAQTKISKLSGRIAEQISPAPVPERPPIGPPPTPAKVTVLPPGTPSA